ncbi:neural-cadherin [Caerostris extrusa]|uniref:Neural-cadherin n=1 Tax=Caerostris extrusa TaxID=172846 RepID=A0AAV4SMP0_CAEEX|nr:neural-cadherin [Caerostris extrusa]
MSKIQMMKILTSSTVPLPMQAVVQLNAPAGTSVFKLQARDHDLDNNIHYFLVRDRTGGRFEVDEMSGEVRTVGSDPFMLDQEYVLYVKAEDLNGIKVTGKEQSGAGTFTIGATDGIVKLAKDLDYEDLRQPKKYSLQITASEESGGFQTSVEVKTHLSATDADSGKNAEIMYSLDKEDFTIDSRGVIRLIDGSIHLDKDKYELNVTAKDDGACCKNGALSTHTSTALVVVFITDVNDNKPVFEKCASYNPKVEENAESGTFVIRVEATDQDKGYNGQVRYSVVQQPNQRGTKFIVDEITGDVRTNKVFNREGEDGRSVSVTLKATDRGNPPLEGVCSFKVEIADVNDNAPLFHPASDEDADNNGVVIYSLFARSVDDDGYFEINPESGWIHLKKSLDKLSIEKIILLFGINQFMALFFIKENIQPGQEIAAIKARSGIPDNPRVFYTIIKGGTEQTNGKDTFYLTQYTKDDETWAGIYVNYVLDYEKVQQYNLTVRVENNGAQQLASEATVYILLEDVNDEIPLFVEQEQETVLEGMPIGTKVTQIRAVDKDGTYPNNKVYYSIEPKDDGDKFRIDRNLVKYLQKKFLTARKDNLMLSL